MGAPYGREYYIELKSEVDIDLFKNKLINSFKSLYYLQGCNYNYERDWKWDKFGRQDYRASNVLNIYRVNEDREFWMSIYIELFTNSTLVNKDIKYIKLLDWSREASDFMMKKSKKISNEIVKEFKKVRLLYGNSISDRYKNPIEIFTYLDKIKDYQLIGASVYIDKS